MNITLDITPQLIQQLDQVIKDSVALAVKDLTTIEKVMTKKEVGEFFQVSAPTVDAFRYRGLPHFQEGTVRRYLYSEVVSWMKNNMELIESKRKR